MALIQEIKNGQVVQDTSSNKTTENKNNFDKDMFLQLLVAEMKYQDPLEPTTNTEYVSELANFSQIEATQNVQDKMDEMSAANYVGKYVILNTTDSSGNQKYVSGMVDFLEKKDDGYYVSVDDGLYSIDDIETVADEKYYTAMLMTKSFEDAISKLPNLNNVSLDDVNFYYEDKGAFTGEISAKMILDAGAEYIIIGHSERRGIFGEDDTMINKKLKKAHESGLKPILLINKSIHSSVVNSALFALKSSKSNCAN